MRSSMIFSRNSLRMCSSEKKVGEGVLLLLRNPYKDLHPKGASRPRDLSSFPVWESVLPAPTLSGNSIATMEHSDPVGKVLSSHATKHALLYDAARGFARVGRALRSQFPAPGFSKARLYPVLSSPLLPLLRQRKRPRNDRTHPGWPENPRPDCRRAE